MPAPVAAGGSWRPRGWPPPRGSGIVAALAITQTVGYGVLYYSFAVLLTPMAADLNASTTEVTGALTAATLIGALAAVPIGRWLDRRGGRALMTLGSLAATALVFAWARVDTLAGLYAVWIGIGLASAMVLYEPAFAVVVTWFDARRRAEALLAVTVVAGFASSIFLPLTSLLVDHYGWRRALLVLAALYGTVSIPLHGLILRPPPHTSAAPADRLTDRPAVASARQGAVRSALADRGFWLLATAFVAQSAAVSALGIHLVAYLVELGQPATLAGTIAGLLGVLSVSGRLLTTALQRRVAATTVVAAVFALQAAAALAFPVVGRSTAGAIAAVTAFGLGFGVATIARPSLLAERYGTSDFATVSGLVTAPVTLARAVAPLAAAAIRQVTGSYTLMLIAAAVACGIAAACIALTTRTPAPRPGLPIRSPAP